MDKKKTKKTTHQKVQRIKDELSEFDKKIKKALDYNPNNK